MFNKVWKFNLLLAFLTENIRFQVNMEKPCPFWEDDRQCSSKECSIGYCDDEVPLMLRQGANSVRYLKHLSNGSSANGSIPAPTAPMPATISVSDDKHSLISSHYPSVSYPETEKNGENVTILQMNDGHALESVGSTGSNSKSVALDEQCEESNQFDPLDRSLSEGDKVQLKNIDIFDYNEYEFCDIDGRLFLFVKVFPL